ncbi:membrane protein [Photobacterium aquae]|uniref:Membrane protein n=1 Tax=Photobacterium aquae TaxID=1195763 RepID=A0A0J1HC75_9GAMM|nr:DedA family protein [Photobacterium aquae]KLV09260.1 membrane protein [Photobacterium aquae]
MLETLQHIINELAPYLHQYGYAILALTIALEGIGIPTPGQSFLIVSSILAANGEMSIEGVLLVGASSAFFGNMLGYLTGLKFGNLLLKKGWLKPQTETKLHQFIGRFGLVALLISRFVEGLKQTMSLGCGIAKMPFNTFIASNALATTIWVTVFGIGPVVLMHELSPFLNFYHTHRMTVWCAGTGVVAACILSIIWWQYRERPQA